MDSTLTLGVSTSSDFDTVLMRLNALVSEEDEETDGASHPTDSALARALKLLSDSYLLVGETYPVADVFTSYDGGIRMEWTRPDRNIRLVIPPTPWGQAYIYYEAGDDYGGEEVSAHTLARRLKMNAV